MALLRQEISFDRFVILQGLEYPIKSNDEIDAFFESQPQREYILGQNISDCSDPNKIHKYSLYWFMDNKNFIGKLLCGFNSRVFLKPGRIPKFKKNYTLDHSGHHLKIYQGCAQFGITRACAEYLVRFHDKNPKFNRYFKTMYAPDEAYFHTIIYNSSFVENTPNGKAISKPHLTDFENLTYFEYPDVVTLFKKKKDWPRLRDSGFLYFRKASSESVELLDYIDSVHRHTGI